jgi:pimeloyl-ACP methyl ester carboxylesterase
MPTVPTPAPTRKVIFVDGINSQFNCNQVDFPETQEWWNLWTYIEQNAGSLVGPSDLYIFDYKGNWDACGSGQNRANYRAIDTCGSISAATGYADVMANWFAGLVKNNPTATFDIIAHSMGGVVVGQWLASEAAVNSSLLQKVHSVTTLDSPLAGRPIAEWLEPLARFTILGACSGSADAVADLLPTGPAVVNLNAPASPTGCLSLPAPNSANITRLGFAFTAIGNFADIVVPGNVSCLPGAMNVTIFTACGDNSINHSCTFSDSTARNAILTAITN